MHDPYYRDPTATLYAANPLDVLIEMPDNGVDCIVTCPPPWRPYPRHQEWRRHGTGYEPTPALYIASLRRVLAEAHRVLADEGTCWLITSDRYATDTGWDGPATGRHSRGVRDHSISGLSLTSLIGLPWQIAFAAQDDGWIIRNAIVWHHPTAEPDDEPAVDRLSSRYELIFLLVKQRRYYFDLDPIRQPLRRPDFAGDPPAVGGNRGATGCLDASARRRPGKRRGVGKYATVAGNCRNHGAAMLPIGRRHDAAHPDGKNPGDVWTLPTPPAEGLVPIEVPVRCVAAGCRPGGAVLDTFVASEAIGLAVRHLGRSFIGIAPDLEVCERVKARLSSHPQSEDS